MASTSEMVESLNVLILADVKTEIERIIYVDGPIYPTPPLGQDTTQGQFFKWSLTGLNSEFSFS